MEEKVIYDFDAVVSRAGTHAEKYDALQNYFGTADAEPFWVADMDLPTPAFLTEQLRARLDHSLFGYTEQYEGVFNSIRWWMKHEHGVAVEQAWVSLSPSVVTSICMAIQAYTNPGESVALLSPVYGPFFSCSQMNGRTVADCRMQVKAGRFEIDFTALEQILARPDVKLMLLCNPHNPGGRVWNEAELTRLVACCKEHGVVLFSDEIHCDIVYAPHRHLSLLHIEGAHEIGIVAHSIGKTFNTSGLQASFCMIPNPGLRTQFRAAADRAHAGDINLLGKVALETALSPAGSDYKKQLLTYLRENTQQVCNRLKPLASLDVMEPEATFLVWCDFRNHGPWPEVFKRLLDEANVALSGGTFFGPAGEGWFRINCAHPRSLLLPAVDRVVETFRT